MQCRKRLTASAQCTQGAAEYEPALWTSSLYRTQCQSQRQPTPALLSRCRVRAHSSEDDYPEFGRLLPHSSPALKVSASRAESA
ncbi:hypothetical protein PsYK624_140200 [Phanerochaete sordida]|uniref:Uncharacterized protein n=1 Tax=Phanerochaete sordida TaxID=48140 RepID=A0A9P3GP61_9APHY|nr:hypothetical protein PsYK624_140200 [Phanerochaete sordida]